MQKQSPDNFASNTKISDFEHARKKGTPNAIKSCKQCNIISVITLLWCGKVSCPQVNHQPWYFNFQFLEMIIFQFKWQQDRENFLILISMKFNLQFFLSAGCRAWSGRSGGMGLIVQVSDLPWPTLPPPSTWDRKTFLLPIVWFYYLSTWTHIFPHSDKYICPHW